MADDPPHGSGDRSPESDDASPGADDPSPDSDAAATRPDGAPGPTDGTPMMPEQELVAAFVETHDLAAPPAYRLLDLVSEVGEVAKGAATSTGYGASPGDLAVAEDELGDALFALLALAEALDADAGAALRAAVEKYERRLDGGDDPGSGQ